MTRPEARPQTIEEARAYLTESALRSIRSSMPSGKTACDEAVSLRGLERLADAVRALSVDADRPRPGHVHVAPLEAGGFSGRRSRISSASTRRGTPATTSKTPSCSTTNAVPSIGSSRRLALALYRDRPRESRAGASRVRRAPRGRVDRDLFELEAAQPRPAERAVPVAVLPRPLPRELRLARRGLQHPARGASRRRRIRAGRQRRPRRHRVVALAPRGRAPRPPPAPRRRSSGPSTRTSRTATARRRRGTRTTSRSGTAGSDRERPELDPRASGEPQSASRLETLAQCPFRYFLKHVLRVEAPEEVERDATRWLDAMKAGSLLHEVFRLFFERITAAGQKPQSARHARVDRALAEAQIAAWREKIPPASELAFEERRDEILLTSRTFLALEEEHCREVTPRFFEVPFGLPRAASRSPVASPDPVPIAIGAGQSFLLRGSIDRVDEAPDGTFQVWDYKTGST